MTQNKPLPAWGWGPNSWVDVQIIVTKEASASSGLLAKLGEGEFRAVLYWGCSKKLDL